MIVESTPEGFPYIVFDILSSGKHSGDCIIILNNAKKLEDFCKTLKFLNLNSFYLLNISPKPLNLCSVNPCLAKEFDFSTRSEGK